MKDVRLRYLAQINPPPSQRVHASEVPFVPMEAIGENGGIEIKESKPREELNGAFTQFESGDVVVAKITPCFENGKGALIEGLPGGFGAGTTELHVLRSGPKLDPHFLFYVTMSHQFRRLGAGAMSGAAGQKRVPADFIADYRLTAPSCDGQRAIADFLDRETARIDDLIAKKERLISLSRERTVARITALMTHGLNGNSAVKDSGLQWLGGVPQHWKFAPV
jgi:type I restriction enzyme, S subunit